LSMRSASFLRTTNCESNSVANWPGSSLLQQAEKSPAAFRLPGLQSKLRWLRGKDLNLRPSGYEPDELPGCSTPRYSVGRYSVGWREGLQGLATTYSSAP